ncbi:homeodomain-interacting protein kinase 3-like [Fundulus heteroclitus]|uniref:homeodomain-interacting protein kinase 3-like n=1 Tax=Fundulus heteroclitus TaxID=8078 RepID=UPI00165A1F30|nr:homeodomain-interacting protein kinase 3-like [Fundulus heteroclitus]
MKEEIKVKLKLDKYVVLPGKLARYHTEGFLGEGSYGKVVKCTKLDTNEAVAVKIVRKDRFRQGKKEARMLKKIQKLDPEKNNLLKFIENFKYKGHFVLAFEMLDVSIYDFMSRRNFAPLHLSEIRVVAQQLLVALNALKRAGLVHADIKPDNIMLVNHESQPFKVKLIDFGLAVKVSKLWFAGTIQAIGYRAPEVILGLPMDESVDMWALGCCLAYMYLGYNLYPTHCEYEVIRAIVQIHGQPRDDVLKKAKDVKHFFTKLAGSSDRMFRLNTPAEYTNATGSATQHKSTVYKGLRSLDDLLITRPRPKDPAEPENSLGFISLLKRMLLVDSNVRITPTEALAHCFITMKHLSDERYSPNVPSAWKMATGCQLRAFAAERCDTPSEAVRRKMLHAKQDGETRGGANRVADKEWIRRTLFKMSLCAACQDGSDQSDAAAGEGKDEPSVEAHNNTLAPKTFA